jgi:hypothetical protein
MFGRYSVVGDALLAKVRSEYPPVQAEYPELIAFNDRYTGIETFERAYAAYRQAFRNDDIAGMLRERPAILQSLEQARARKKLLTEQTKQVAQYEQTLADYWVAIEREELSRFGAEHIAGTASDLRKELAYLSQTAPGKRGDISADLQIIFTRLRDIESAIRAARTTKTEAEQTRRVLVDSEGATRRILEAAMSNELKKAFDVEFVNSSKELISRFRELESIDVWVLHTRQDDVDAAVRKLGELQNRVSDIKAEIARVGQLVNDLKELNNRMDQGGRQLLDGPALSTLTDVAKSVAALSVAKIPLSSENRRELADTQAALSRIREIIQNTINRQESLKNFLADAYMSYIVVKRCYDMRRGYLVVHISDPEMLHAKEQMRLIEKQLAPKLDTGVSSEALWSDADRRVQETFGDMLSIIQQIGSDHGLCKNRLMLLSETFRQLFPDSTQTKKDF